MLIGYFLVFIGVNIEQPIDNITLNNIACGFEAFFYISKLYQGRGASVIEVLYYYVY